MSKQSCCEEDMKYIAGYDNPGPSGSNRAFNLWMCRSCGRIRKLDVWEDAGVLDIDVFNTVTDSRKEVEGNT